MSIWLSLLIPLLGAFVMLKWFRRNLVWWEVVIPAIICSIFILGFKLMVEKIQVNDTEYHGAIIIEARYYEPWETYVHRTCTRTVSCGKNCTTTVTYDCSYCDYNRERWTVLNSLGQEFEISKEFYNFLMKKWKAKPKFVELNRDIDYTYSCGKDGDMYSIKWDGDPMSTESTTTDHWYENRVQAAHSSFDFIKVTEEDVKNYDLYNYPKIEGIMQETVLGAEKIKWIHNSEIKKLKQWNKFLNGYLGVNKHARIYVLFFVDKSILSANMQEAYWKGGNDNEVVVCIGLSSKTKDIQWVKPFSWSKTSRVIPDIREDLMKNPRFNVDIIAKSIKNNVEKSYIRRDFKEFSYITVDPPNWAIWVTFFVTLAITVGICYWAIYNDIEGNNDPIFGKRR